VVSTRTAPTKSIAAPCFSSSKSARKQVLRRPPESNCCEREQPEKSSSVATKKHHEKIANHRRDFLNKLAIKLIRKYDVIVLEDLQIKNMVRNHHLAKSILDSG